MIFQTSVKLEIEGKNVHAIIDLDTGMIGFTESYNSEALEFDYFSSPPEYKIAFAESLEKITASEHQSNSLICRKGRAGRLIQEFWANTNSKKVNYVFNQLRSC